MRATTANHKWCASKVGGEEGFRHSGWSGQTGDKDREERAKLEFDEALGTEALLLGRRSDEWLASVLRCVTTADDPTGHLGHS